MQDFFQNQKNGILLAGQMPTLKNLYPVVPTFHLVVAAVNV
jgi:hypothetical protein